MESVEITSIDPEYPGIEIYDAGPQVTDRYSVRIQNSIYSMSANPLSPRGVCLYAGQAEDLPGYTDGECINLRNCPRPLLLAIISILQDWVHTAEQVAAGQV